MNVLAYTYEADHHCEACAYARFGRNDQGDIVGVDDEGNEIGPWFEDESIDYPAHCGECHVFLENRLTADGVHYLEQAFSLPDGRADVLALWREFYADDLERAS